MFTDSVYSGCSIKLLRPGFIGTQQYFSLDNPYQAAGTPHTLFALLQNQEQGLYIGCHETTPRLLSQFVSEQHPGGLDSAIHSYPDAQAQEIDGHPVYIEHAITHFLFTPPGQSEKPPPVFMKPYMGDWTFGVDLYKAWRKTWHRTAPTPEWAKEVHAWYQIQLNSTEDSLRYSYTDLIELGKDCARHGVKLLVPILD